MIFDFNFSATPMASFQSWDDYSFQDISPNAVGPEVILLYGGNAAAQTSPVIEGNTQ